MSLWEDDIDFNLEDGSNMTAPEVEEYQRAIENSLKAEGDLQLGIALSLEAAQQESNQQGANQQPVDQLQDTTVESVLATEQGLCAESKPKENNDNGLMRDGESSHAQLTVAPNESTDSAQFQLPKPATAVSELGGFAQSQQPKSAPVGSERGSARVQKPTAEAQTAADADRGEETSPRRRNIDDAIAEMVKNRGELSRLHVFDGDTLVYIDGPTRQSDQDRVTYEQVATHFAQPFRTRSHALKATGSEYFEYLLGSTAQFRVLRQRNLVGRLPQGIKYVIDLTPPNEGDEAILLIQDLSCTMGVRQWALSAVRWSISRTLVGGNEEFSALPTFTKINVPALVPQRAVNYNGAAQNAASKGRSSKFDFVFLLPLDYSPVRHRFAIERVLHAIEGLDPKLDSAVKVWTTCAVAERFGVKQSLLTDFIVRWLRAPPNTIFAEVMPEVTLKMADGLQVEPLCRDMFALLVGEAALTEVCEGRGFDRARTTHGRVKEDLSDRWLTRIEYARHVFVTRIRSQFESLVGADMEWIDNLAEFRKLWHRSRDTSSQTYQAFAHLAALLKDYIRGGIYHLLCSRYSTMPGPVQCNAGGEALFPNGTFSDTWNILSHRQRYFTRSFWDAMSGVLFEDASSNFTIKPKRGYNIFYDINNEARNLIAASVFKRISLNDVKENVGSFYLLCQTSSSTDTAPSNVSSSLRSQLSLPYRVSGEIGHSSGEPQELPIRSAADPNSSSFGVHHTVSGTNLGLSHTPPPPYERRTTEPQSTLHSTASFFSLDAFFTEVQSYLHSLSSQILASPDALERDPLELALTNTLTCLSKEEMKFLPLWAGGNDDDSAGVFNDDVPASDVGFSTAGPCVHIGSSAGASSDYEMVRGDDTVGTSTVVNDGNSEFATDRRRVYAANEMMEDDEWDLAHGDSDLDDVLWDEEMDEEMLDEVGEEGRATIIYRADGEESDRP